jgi:hypothetical protein
LQVARFDALNRFRDASPERRRQMLLMNNVDMNPEYQTYLGTVFPSIVSESKADLIN